MTVSTDTPLMAHLRANLFDGEEGGRITMRVEDLLEEVTTLVGDYLSQHPELDDLLDRSSSASRQHFIDTGRFLFVGESDAGLAPTPDPRDPSDILREQDYEAWIKQPRCGATSSYGGLSYLCIRRGEHRAHQSAIGHEWSLEPNYCYVHGQATSTRPCTGGCQVPASHSKWDCADPTCQTPEHA